MGERGADGYHHLQTVFQTIALYDRLAITVEEEGGRGAASVQMGCDVPELAGDSNLAARAARAVLRALKIRRRRVRLTLHKGIPAGAGLGGGSSDAAAVIRALPPLLGRRLARKQQLALASALGADVPFFLLGGRAIGLGPGIELHPLPDAGDCPLVVVHPGLHISTAKAYRRLDQSRRDPALTIGGRGPMIQNSREWMTHHRGDRLKNDFEPVVFSAYPELARLKAILTRAGASPALLSGSGSAMFGVFDSAAGARRAAAQLRRQWPRWQVWVTRTVTRRQLSAQRGGE